MKLHNVDSLSRSSGVGALDNSAVSTSPVVHHDLLNVYQSSARLSYDLGNVLADPLAAPVGHPLNPLASSGDDQLQVPGRGPLDSSSSSLSPTSLLFPLPPSLSVPPSSSSAMFRPPLSSSSSSDTLPSAAVPSSFPSSYSSSSFSASLPSHPSFTPSSLSSASLPSSSFVTASLPPSVSSLFPMPSPSPFVSESSFASSSLPPSFSSSFTPSLPSVPPPPGFPPSSSSSSSSSFCLLFLFSPSYGSSSSSSSFGSLPSSALADHQVWLLGLPSDYQSLARWFVTSGGTDFAGLVSSSFPHLLPDIARDFASGSSLFLTTLHSVAPPPASVSSSASHPPLSAHLSSLPYLGCLLTLLLSLSLYPLRRLALLRFLLLLVFLTLLRLSPFLSWVLPWCMGWVWVSLLLLGFPLPLITRLLLLHMLLPPPLLGILLPHTHMILLRRPLLPLRPNLLPMRMSASLTMTRRPLIPQLLPCL